MSVVAYPSLFCPGLPSGVSAPNHRALPRRSSRKLNNSLKNKEKSFGPETERASETPGSPVARQTHPDQSSCSVTCAIRVSLLKSKVRLFRPRHKREDVGNYAGFEIYEEQQRAEQRRKASAETIATTCSGETLIDIDEKLPTYAKDLEPEYDEEHPTTHDDGKLGLVRSRLSLCSVNKMGKRNARTKISETSDECTARKSAKAERKKERRNRWFGGMSPDWAEDHEGDDCGWYCSKHRYSGCQATMDWWCVAGMYM